jgi:hypothetical protein
MKSLPFMVTPPVIGQNALYHTIVCGTVRYKILKNLKCLVAKVQKNKSLRAEKE